MMTHLQCMEFVRLYRDGILRDGLLTPLITMSKDKSDLGRAATSLFDLQVRGHTPQSAIETMDPRLPSALSKLIVLGFNRSNLDWVLSEALAIYENANQHKDVETELNTLLSRLAAPQSKAICIDCWQSELEKIIARAALENATLIFLEQEDESYFHQKFISTKLVKVSEPAISAAYKTIKQSLFDLADRDKTLLLNEREITVRSTSDSGVRLFADGFDLIVHFET